MALAWQKNDVLLLQMGKASKKKKITNVVSTAKEPPLKSFPVSAGKGLFDRHIVRILSIVTLGLMVYINTIHSPFLFDDIPYIAESQAIRSLRYFVSFYQDLSNIIIYIKTRYITHLSFALNYAMNGLAVSGYHIFNISVHIINALIVYWMVTLTFKTPAMRPSSGNYIQYSRFIAFFSALVFVCHPVQIQAVTYITQRFASFATLFYLLSVTLYIRARLGQEAETGHKAVLPPFRIMLLFILAFTSTIIAMKTKEISFTIPVVIALYEFMFFSGPLKRKVAILIPYLLTLPIIPLAMLSSNIPASDIVSDVSEAARSLSSVSRMDYLLTQLGVITTYIRLIFFPINQNFDYDYPIYHALPSPAVFLPFLLLASLLSIGVFIFWRYRNSAPLSRLISFGIFWFFITLSVESSIIPITDVIFEHRVYLPSVGAFIAITASLLAVKNRMDEKTPQFGKAVIMAFALIILMLSVSAHMRNRVWQDDIRFWQDGVAKSPRKERVYNNLGAAYADRGMIDEAIEQYRTALQLDPKSVNANNNLGNALYKKGMAAQAIERYETALLLDPKSVNAHNNLGIAYFDRGMIDQAEEHYRTALQLNPLNANANNNMGNVFFKKGMIDRAIEQYQTAIQIDPKKTDTHNNLGIAYANRGMIDQAIEQYQTAIQIDPMNIDAHNNLGIIYSDRGKVDQAIEQYQAALQKDPKKADVRNNLGNAFFKKGMIDRAMEQYQTALQINPNHADAHNNLGLAYFNQGKVDQAIEQYRTALKINPKYADAHNNLSAAYEKKGLKSEAAREARASIESRPELQEALKLLDSIGK